jgi:glutaredoxin
MTKIKIYGKGTCPYCTLAKEFYANKGYDFEYISVDADKDFEKLSKETGLDIVPQIFINGKLIGGWIKTQELEKSGELDALLDSTA